MLQKQKYIKELNFTKSSFVEYQTEILLHTITESEIFNSLTYFNICDSTIEASNPSVNYLALLITKAKNLKLIDITGMSNKSRIMVEVRKEKGGRPLTTISSVKDWVSAL